MSIRFVGRRGFRTSGSNAVGAGQSTASVYFKLRVGEAATSGGTLVIIGKEFAESFFVNRVSGAAAGFTRFTFAWKGGNQVTASKDLANGVTYSLAMTLEGNVGKVWVDGAPTNMPAFTGPTGSTARPLFFGVENSTTSGVDYEIDDLLVVHGHALTAQQLADLRDGVIAPSAITEGTNRWRWTLDGTLDADVVAGDPGLIDGQNSLTFNTLVDNGGSATYTDALEWAPSVELKESRVATSGRTVFLFYRTISTQVDVTPTAIVAPPTIYRNGASLGVMSPVVCSGEEPFAMFELPGSSVISPGDVVTIDAATGHVATAAGTVSEATGHVASNRSGVSCFRDSSFIKTLPMGINGEWWPCSHQALMPFRRNLAQSMGGFANVTARDANQKPTAFSGTSTTASLYDNGSENGIDATGLPGPTGLFVVRWDDLGGTSFQIESANSATTTVTPRTDLENLGSGGLGRARVYNVQRAAGSTVARTHIRVRMSHATGQPKFDNLDIRWQGDFSYTDGQPVVLDGSDPWAVSSHYLSRVANIGSFRNIGVLASSTSKISEPEHTRDLTDFTWGFGPSKYGKIVRYVSVHAFDQAETPWIYHPTAGEKFAATLASGIDATTTTLAISDAATAPIIIGLRLYVDGEIMRVRDVSGTTVTVDRGAEGTTPASHAAGAIQVGHRCPMPPLGAVDNNGAIIRWTTQGNHGLYTGTSLVFEGTGWPTLNFTGGTSVSRPTTGTGVIVTGPDTWVGRIGKGGSDQYSSPQVTLAGGPVTLTPATNFSTVSIPGAQVPSAYIALAANRMGVKQVFTNIPHMATNDCVRKIAAEWRDNLHPGTELWVELSLETWNFPNPNEYMRWMSRSLYQGLHNQTFLARRTGEIRAIFESVFGARAGQLRFYLNVQGVTTSASPLLTWAAAQVPPVKLDGLAIAPYIDPTSNYFPTATQNAFALLDPDQALDLWIHAQWHNAAIGIRKHASSWQAHIDTYNSTTGFDCKLIAYEGSVQTVYKTSVPNFREKERDFVYHPNMRIVEQDWYALMQECGFRAFNIYNMTHDWDSERFLWAYYHGWGQRPGLGDGSDGEANNLLTLATPGFPNSKPATKNQDGNTCSTRGKAILEWNAQSAGPRPLSRRGLARHFGANRRS